MGLLTHRPGVAARRRTAWILTVCTALFVAGAARPATAEVNPLATAIKASYLYKMAPFVDWPAGAFPTPTSPFVLCVVGRDPFGPLLDRAVSGQSVSGRPIVVDRLDQISRNSPCQIAFLAGSATQSMPQALLALRGAPVLTITDDAAAPGIVDFTVAGDRVRFRIDDEAAAENGLTISSKLLSLALKVNPRKASDIDR